MPDTWIPVFKTGTHIDSSGNTKIWTKKDLDIIVSKYDPSHHEAPVVIGHPKDNAPAWGWVESLKTEGNILHAKMKDLVPEFVDLLKNKMFKKRSISLYPDLTLKHIGFLGATPPAVKGLADVAFSNEQNAMSYEFQEEGERESRSKKYGISIREGGNVTKPSEWDDVPDDEWLDPVNYAYPCPDADQTRAAAVYWGRERNRNKYSQEDQEVMNRRLDKFREKFKIGGQAVKEETNMNFWERLKKKLAEVGISFADIFGSDSPPLLYTEADIKPKIDTAVSEALKTKEAEFSEAQKKKETELAEREKKLKAQETDARKKGISDFCEGLKKKGILIPAMDKLGMGITAFMEQVATIETPIEFGEDGKKEKQTPLEFMQSFLTHLPKAIEFKEVAGDDKDVKTGNAGEKIEALVKEKMKANKDLTYGAAFSEVQKENKDLALEYAEELKGGK